jgi:NH3-dependent NAD+ synthetase
MERSQAKYTAGNIPSEVSEEDSLGIDYDTIDDVLNVDGGC